MAELSEDYLRGYYEGDLGRRLEASRKAAQWPEDKSTKKHRAILAKAHELMFGHRN